MKRHLLLALIAFVIAALLPQSAQAFCGFYVSGADGELFNDATQVVLMRSGTRTVLSMQNNYDGPPENFAMVVPVPIVLQKENVKTLSHEVFKKVDRMAAPRLVEYWETDPCYVPEPVPEDKFVMATMAAAPPAPQGVKIEAQFTVGEYDVVVLSADDSMGLDSWLRQEKYNIPAGAEPVLKPYIESGMKFFVAKVNLDKVKRDEAGRVVLSPLRFHYDTDAFSLPIRLGMLNAKSAQDLIIHVIAPGQRYEVANRPNVTIPTNIEVHDAVKERFGEFYAALFDETLKKTPGAVVTEYSWDAATCDPCPGPTLLPDDFLALGSEVLPDEVTSGLVLTRLHARYTAAEIKDDLIFKAAPPIVGGRESLAPNDLEKGATPSGTNNFQGRYIIRHPWKKKITCSNPVRGRWGGPNNGGSASGQETAFAPRGQLKLAAIVGEDIGEIDLKSSAPITHPSGPTNSAKKKSGCSCQQARSGNPSTPWSVGLLLAFVAFVGLRRRS